MPKKCNFLLRCRQCNVTFRTYYPTAHFCSHACASDAKRAPILTRQCDQCGSTFSLKRGSAANARFCNRICTGLAKRNQISKICPTCGDPFTCKRTEHERGKGRYCSVACAYSATPEERFWTFVDKSGGPDACWLWNGYLTGGYGRFSVNDKSIVPQKIIGAHRFSWILHFGAIPPNQQVCHNCPDGDNPRCVNPRHLWLGTMYDNMADRNNKGRHAHGERSGRSKLSESDVREIRRRYALGGISTRKLAVEFGVSGATIAAIAVRLIWKHI